MKGCEVATLWLEDCKDDEVNVGVEDSIMSEDDNNTSSIEDTVTGNEDADEEVVIGVEDSKTPNVDVPVRFAEDITGD